MVLWSESAHNCLPFKKATLTALKLGWSTNNSRLRIFRGWEWPVQYPGLNPVECVWEAFGRAITASTPVSSLELSALVEERDL
ncbi:hypothetical protein TNCV_4194071 [Trichonephila clavipes]|nr:hypothetical protein TNCV_4194071 [Trichonephila clavipes]